MDNAVIYMRVSTDKQDEQNQLKDCKQLISHKNWNLLRVYSDHALSAYKENIIRPQFEQMLKDAKTREFQHIVVFNLDRYSRKDPEKVVDQITTLSTVYGVQVNAVHGDEWRDLIEMLNALPSMGFAGKAIVEFLRTFFLGIQAERNRRESEKIGERVRASRKFQSAKKKGTVGRPGTPPQVILAIKELVDMGVPYESIRDQCTYKIGNKVHKPSRTIVSLIKTGKMTVPSK